MGWLWGTQYQNAAFRAVPPSRSAFSRSTTSSPSQRANSAVGSPPPPPPTTTTSACTSTAPAAARRADSRVAIDPPLSIAPWGGARPRPTSRERLGGGDLRGHAEDLPHRRVECLDRVLGQDIAAPADHAVGA